MSLVFKRESAYGPVMIEKVGGGPNVQKERNNLRSNTVEVNSMEVISGVSSDGLSSGYGSKVENLALLGNKSLKRRLDDQRPEPLQTQARVWKKPGAGGSGAGETNADQKSNVNSGRKRRRLSVANSINTSNLKSQATTAAQRYRIRNRRHSINTTVKRIHMDTMDLSFENEQLEKSFYKKNAQALQNSLLLFTLTYFVIAVAVALPPFSIHLSKAWVS